MKAKYQLEDTFKITGRGIIFSGVILEGEIATNDWISFQYKNEILKRRIIGVEFFSGKIKSTHIGLMIKTKNESEIDNLKNWNPEKTIASIFQGIKKPEKKLLKLSFFEILRRLFS